jgi:hypothetical protein
MDTMFRALACFVLGAVLGFRLPSVNAQSPSAGYVVTFLKSDREWRYGIKREPYDKVSEYLVDQLRAALDKKGFHTAPEETAQYHLTVELLEVTSHAATVLKPGNDVSATLQIAAGSQIVYTRGYHGEAKTWNAPGGAVIRRAADELVKNIVEDEQITRVLAEIAPSTTDVALPPIVPPPPPDDAPHAPPKTISIGQTEGDVVAIFGEPERIVRLDMKVVFYYRDFGKVIFVDGKVADVQ